MHKSSNKSLALILSILLVFSAILPVSAATSVSDYESHWAASDIRSGMAAGIITGYADGTFRPENAITRAEFFVLVNNAFKFTTTAAIAYTDVAGNAWYAPVIGKAKAAGYINGYPDGGIHPDGNISRQEVAVVLSRIMNMTPSSTTLPYTDATEVASWSKQAVIAAAEAKIMVGYPEGDFKPEAAIKRAEALVAVMNCYSHSTPVATPVVTPAAVTGSAIVVTPGAVTVNPGAIVPVIPVGTIAPVGLGTAGDFVILAKTGISSVPSSIITGNIGVSPIDATALTGFSLTADASNQFATSAQITGKAYASNYAPPTPANLTTSVSNMETAYTDAAGRAANYTELYSGDVSGKTLTAGVYKWGTGVLINTDLTLNGSATDVWIFQIGEGLTQANGIKIILSGGAQAKNVFWQAAETVSIGTGAHFEGIILCQTNISMGTNSSIKGRLFAQSAVTLDAATVVAP